MIINQVCQTHLPRPAGQTKHGRNLKLDNNMSYVQNNSNTAMLKKYSCKET